MNLQQTIADLEKQAQQYLDAANALRALQANGNTSNGGVVASATASDDEAAPKRKQSASAKRATAKAAKNGQKRYVSPETRAKIAAAIKARHAARKAAAA